jgi:hypothetical protein
MQDNHIDALPVVDITGKLLFFVNRGEILAKLMTNLILEEKKPELASD